MCSTSTIQSFALFAFFVVTKKEPAPFATHIARKPVLGAMRRTGSEATPFPHRRTTTSCAHVNNNPPLIDK